MIQLSSLFGQIMMVFEKAADYQFWNALFDNDTIQYNFMKKYEIVKELGRGSFGKVYKIALRGYKRGTQVKKMKVFSNNIRNSLRKS